MDSAFIVSEDCLGSDLFAEDWVELLGCGNSQKLICVQSSKELVQIGPPADKKYREQGNSGSKINSLMAVGVTESDPKLSFAWLVQMCGNEVTHLFNRYTLVLLDQYCC